MVKRGQIWWGDLDRPTGSEPGFPRPLLILQSNFFNETALGTIVTVALTSHLGRAMMPGNVLLRRRETGMSKDSVVVVSQLVTVDRDQLLEKICTLGSDRMSVVEEGVRLLLDL